MKTRIQLLISIIVMYGILCFICNYKLLLISSSSMEKTLLFGDVVLVRKFSQKTKNSSDEILPIRNKIIVFNNLTQDRKRIIKRCIAVSGDTIHFNQNNFNVNNCKSESNDNAIFPYVVKVKNKQIFFSYIDSAKYTATNSSNGSFTINSNEKFIQELVSFNVIETYKNVSPNFSQYLYSNPLTIVPKKGDHVFKKSIIRYGDLFRKLEKNNSTIQNNYYYVLGDNWANSIDSRFWGMLPQKDIVGSTSFILYSYIKYSTKAKFRFNRFFLRID